MIYTDITSFASQYPAEGNYPVRRNHSPSEPAYQVVGISEYSEFLSEAGTIILSTGTYNPKTAFAYTEGYLEASPIPVTHIHSIPNEPYEVVKLIPVHFRRGQPSGIIASFEEANIAYVGETWIEAFNGLQAEILDTFEDYIENESILGPEPKRQLEVLRDFLSHENEC